MGVSGAAPDPVVMMRLGFDQYRRIPMTLAERRGICPTICMWLVAGRVLGHMGKAGMI